MTSKTKTLDDRLLYRRQYFVGPKYIDKFPTWNKLQIGNDVFITAHPDLELTTAKKDDKELVLLGFMFDSENYKLSNQDILNDLLSSSNTTLDIFKSTYKHAGRWLLIYDEANETILFNDAGGLRQLFYSKVGDETWCSTQPHILAEILHKPLREDKDFLATFNSSGYKDNERTLVSDETLFKDIYHLTPNHYLNYSDCIIKRYWPDKIIENIPLDIAAKISSKILTELMKAAHFRYETANIITAGWDTRVLLAASKPNKNDNHYFVHKLPKMDDAHEDIVIPQELAKNHNLIFDVVDCTEYDVEFDKINSQNVSFAQSDHKKYQYYNYYKQFEGKLIISGNVSPLIKELFHPVDSINPVNLARLLNYHNDKYAVKAISTWLDQTLEYSKKFNVSIEKLLYWEVRFGKWAAMFNAELDIATEEFSPFNCRNLINLGLATSSEYRTKPNEFLYKNIINNLWPELLETPINPNSYAVMENRKISTFRSVTVKFLEATGLYRLARYFYRKLVLR